MLVPSNNQLDAARLKRFMPLDAMSRMTEPSKLTTKSFYNAGLINSRPRNSVTSGQARSARYG
jgi:hypothetical protein